MTVEHAGRHVEHRVHRVAVRAHASDLLLDELEVTDRTLELVAGLRPLDRLIHGTLSAAEHAGREGASTVVEAGERDIESAAFFMQQVGLGHLHIREPDACLPGAADAHLAAVLREDVDAFHVGVAHNRGDLLLAVDCLLAHHGEQARDRARGRPFLLAVDDVVLAVFAELDGRLLTTRVAADLRLRQTERAEPFLGQLGQPAGLLLVGAEEHDCLAADRLMRGHHDRSRAAVLADGFQHAVVAGDAHAQAAVLLADGHA